jgi:hypothetical protein
MPQLSSWKDLGMAMDTITILHTGNPFHEMIPHPDSFTASHPVHNVCLPPDISHEKFLLDSETDVQNKHWDEKLLRSWEELCNGGKVWVGRGCLESQT